MLINYKEKLNYYYLAKYMKEETPNLISEDPPIPETPPEKTDKMIKLEELHLQNNDIVAWLEIPRN